ncbi:uncharacterized protein LOC114940974 [Nylanderia fulva]|uniref:uncharacterized protein LOC114940974 n=1 Tax=Nylanderia fulva TaxID=613905 RepID=UPI0010FB8D1B|nr:uncharacterized protein LOC114940974 [Nylanderia fulva]
MDNKGFQDEEREQRAKIKRMFSWSDGLPGINTIMGRKRDVKSCPPTTIARSKFVIRHDNRHEMIMLHKRRDRLSRPLKLPAIELTQRVKTSRLTTHTARVGDVPSNSELVSEMALQEEPDQPSDGGAGAAGLTNATTMQNNGDSNVDLTSVTSSAVLSQPGLNNPTWNRQQAVSVRHAFKSYGSTKNPNHILQNLNMTVAKGSM